MDFWGYAFGGRSYTGSCLGMLTLSACGLIGLLFCVVLRLSHGLACSRMDFGRDDDYVFEIGCSLILVERCSMVIGLSLMMGLRCSHWSASKCVVWKVSGGEREY